MDELDINPTNPSVALAQGQPDEPLRAIADALRHRLAEMDEPIGENTLEDPTADCEDEEDNPEPNDDGSAMEGERDLDGAVGTGELPGDAESLARRKALLEEKVRLMVRDTVKDSLFSDPYILETAEAFDISEEERIVRDGKGRLVFYLKAALFEDWKERHQIFIATQFTLNSKPEEYPRDVRPSSSQAMKERAGQIKTRYDCHRRGAKRVQKDRQKGGVSGKTRMRKESSKCGCQSYFNAFFRPAPTFDGRLQNTYRVEYSYQHNHSLGDKDSIGTPQKSQAIKDHIKAMLLRGMSLPAVTDKLIADYASLARFMESDKQLQLSRDNIITYYDVYNLLYAITAKQMRKHENAAVSARLWLEYFKQQGFFTYCDHERDLYYGFSSPWQLDELRKWGDVFWFDGTHHACGRDTYLFSIIVKNKETGFGVPAAFFLTKSRESSILAGWLRALKAKMDELCKTEYQPVVVITDQGQHDINAIHEGFSHEVRVFYCAWHVLQAWERQFTIKNLNMESLSVPERTQRKERVRDSLRDILYAGTVEQAEALIAAFQTAWEDLAPRFIQYMNRNYLDSESDKRRWMYCHRQGVAYSWINTNNDIESWHNALKKYFFRDKQQWRIDTVIYVLVQNAIPHFQQRCIRHTVEVGRMTPARKKALHSRQLAMNHIDRIRMQDPGPILLLPTADDNVFKVRSFQHANIFYEVKADWDKGRIGQFNSCTCFDFANNKMCCKHIALAIIELPCTEFYYTGHREPREDASSTNCEQDQAELATGSSKTSTTPESAMLIMHYAQSIVNSVSIMDKERDIPNYDEVLDILKRAADVCSGLPVLAAHDLSNKRARQRH